jgi:glucose-1-phosphate thymidylyltransferase
LGNGSEIGMNIQYKIQKEPRGLAEAFIIGDDFIGNDDACLILGDNIFYGHGLKPLLKKSVEIVKNENKAVIFGYYVDDPERYGIVTFDENYNVISIKEKPKHPESNYAVVGLYFYPNDVIKKAKNVKPSDRGELEITSINQFYLDEKRLTLNLMSRGFAWLDTGTHESLLEASNFVKIIEERTSLKIACIEEIAFKNKWIDKNKLLKIAKSLAKTGYGNYLRQIGNMK